MRVCVFVDGENLRHTICDLYEHEFDRRDYLPKNADWAGFFDLIVQQATSGEGSRVRTYWYVVQYVDGYPYPLNRSKRNDDSLVKWASNNGGLLKRQKRYDLPKTEAERLAALRELQDTLQKQYHKIRNRFNGFEIVQNGISKKHRSIEFRRSGAIPYNLLTGQLGKEKTVDVNLAVDMVTLSAVYDTAVIVSGDQDYVPATQAVKNLGKHVINVAFNARNGKLLPGGAKRLNQVTDWSIALEWDQFRKVLKIPEKKKA